MTTNASSEVLHADADHGVSGLSDGEAKTQNAAQIMRDRLIAANVLMRYDYAWYGTHKVSGSFPLRH